ncbi:Uncharacterised protein [Mycobacteroides abscessus subsp. abscessus]|nr:Uncharacterised protein [Mycobacteroides abscessus subsp. abscessus]
MRRENDSAFVDFFNDIFTVFSIQRYNAFFFKCIGDMFVMDNHAQYINRPRQVFIQSGIPCYDHCIDNPIAIAPRRNF